MWHVVCSYHEKILCISSGESYVILRVLRGVFGLKAEPLIIGTLIQITNYWPATYRWLMMPFSPFYLKAWITRLLLRLSGSASQLHSSLPGLQSKPKHTLVFIVLHWLVYFTDSLVLEKQQQQKKNSTMSLNIPNCYLCVSIWAYLLCSERYCH